MLITGNLFPYHKTFTSRLVKPAVVNDTFSVKDEKFSSYIGSWYNSFNNLNVKNNIFVRIDRTNMVFVPHKCTLRISLNANYDRFIPNTSSLTNYNENRTIDLIYDTAFAEKEIDEAAWVIERAVNCMVTVTGITILNGPPGVTYPNAALPVLEMQQLLEVDRIGNLSLAPPVIASPFYSSENVRLSWAPISESEAYEIQYLHIPYKFNIRSSPAPNVDSLIFDFRHDATNLIVTTANYIDIPNIWPKGYVVYRVRALGKKLSEPNWDVYSLWSVMERGIVAIGSGTSTKNFIFYADDFNDSVNWQYTNVFSEETKIFSSITFFDGSMRERQNITKSNSTGVFSVAQAIFDFEGRQAVNILPTPVLDNNYFALRPGLNNNSSNTPYSYLDFDLNKSSTSEINLNSMSNSSGAGYYYSSSLFGSDLNSITTLSDFEKHMHSYVPDAEGFPLSQSEFRKDNTGRVYRAGAVGKTHQLTSYRNGGSSVINGKETYTWDGTPTQAELDVLFGNDVGYYQYYKKVMTRDANGQLNVAYLDPYGRTIATALAGNPADAPSLDPITSSGNTIKFDLELKNSRENVKDRVKQLNHSLLVSQRDTVKFYYDLYRDPVHFICDSGFCFDCAFDMTISIQDALNNEMIPGGPLTEFIGNLSRNGVSCGDTPHFDVSPSPLSLVLDPGEYTISKTLTISNKGLEFYRKVFLDSNKCVKSFSDFLAESILDQGITCDWNCDDCDSANIALRNQLNLLRGQALEESIDTLNWEVFLSLKEEISETDSFCNELCKVISPCEQLYLTLLEDMSLGGQYAKYVEYGSDGLASRGLYNIDTTIFRDTCKFNCDSSGVNISRNWRFPQNANNTRYYLNEDGTQALIQVINGMPEIRTGASYINVNGLDYIRPHDLKNVKDFINSWEEQWANSLIYMHPEYCYYKACRAMEPIYAYETEMLNTSSAADAMKKGFYNPLNISGILDTIIINTVSHNLNYSSYENVSLINRDPLLNWYFFNSKYPSGTIKRGQALIDELYSYDYKADVGGSCQDKSASIWKIYEKMRSAHGLSLTPDTCADNLMWPLLRALYLYKRNEWIKTYYDSVCSSGSNGCNLANIQNIKERRWYQGLKPSQMGIKNDYMDENFFSDLESKCKEGDFNGAVDGVVAKNCEDYCQANAANWMSILAQCPSILGASQLRKDSIYNAFVQVCMGGCDFNNPYGSVNVSYDNYGNSDYPDKHIRDVLKRFRVNLIPGVCDDLLINFPGEYDHDYLATSNPEADTCACSKYKQVRASTRCEEDTTGNLASNDCGCGYADSHLKQAVTSYNGVPEKAKCQNCITCSDLTGPVVEFWDRYKEYRDVMLEDSGLFQAIFTNMLNRRIGFNLEYKDYLDYAKNCIDSPSLSGNWLRVWDIIGAEKLVSMKNDNMDYQIRIGSNIYNGMVNYIVDRMSSNPILQIKKTSQRNSQYNDVLFASIDNDISAAVYSTAASSDAMNIACNCEKVLNIDQLMQNGQNNGWTDIQLYQKMYNYSFPYALPTTFNDIRDKCCKLFNHLSQSSSCSPSTFKYGDYFNDDDLDFIDDELTNNPAPLAIFIDPQAPCDPLEHKQNDMVELDTCACKKLKLRKEQWTNNNEGLTFSAYLLKYDKVSTDSSDILNDYCEFLWKSGIKKNRNGTLTQTYSSTSWWNSVGFQNLGQHASDKPLRVPRGLACEPEVERPDPCEDRINCLSLRQYLFFKLTMTDHSDVGLWDMGEDKDGYLDLLDQWNNDYPEGGTYTSGSDAAKRRAFLDALKEEMNNICKNDKCDQNEVYSMDYLLKIMMNCRGWDFGNPCVPNLPKCSDLAKDILDFNKLLNDNTNLKHTYNDNSTTLIDSIPDLYKIPSYDRVDFIMSRFGNYYSKSCNKELYFRYEPGATFSNSNYLRFYMSNTTSNYVYPAMLYNKACIQTGNLGMDDSTWLMGFEYYLNVKYNNCYNLTPKKLFAFVYFYLNMSEHCERPKATYNKYIKPVKKPACPKCYVADTSWLSNFNTFLNQVTKKPNPDQLDDYGWYLKTSSSADYDFPNFYNNPILYNGSNSLDLTYELTNIDVPQLMTEITDGSGYQLKFSLNFPNKKLVWNYSFIVGFTNPRARKSSGCSMPRFFYIDAVYEVPTKYLADYPNCPNAVYNYSTSSYTKCYDTVTLLVEVKINTNNKGIGKEVACLGCKKLCNKPYLRDNNFIDSTSRCSDLDIQLAFNNALTNYDSYLQEEIRKFDSTYIATCMGSRETMRLKYNNRQYHHTLYYYDQAGNLIKTVPPQGVDIDNENLTQSQRQALADERIAMSADYRLNSTNQYALTYHNLITNYKYSTLGQLVDQTTPDGGNSNFWYDIMGRLVISQNSKQINNQRYSYTQFDYLSRITEAGELTKTSDTHEETDLLQDFEEAESTIVSGLDRVTDNSVAWNSLTSNSQMKIIRKSGLNGIEMKHKTCVGMYCLIGQVEYRLQKGLTAGTTNALKIDEKLLGGLSSFDVEIEHNVSGSTWSSLGTINISGSGLHLSNFSIPGTSTGQVRFKITFTPSNYIEGVFLNNFEISHVVVGIQDMNFAVSTNKNQLNSFIAASNHNQVTKSFYNIPPLYNRVSSVFPFGQSNLRGRIGGITYEEVEDNDSNTYDHAFYYDYDIHGNVKRFVQDIPQLEFLSKNLYTLDYHYDLISGKVRSVIYQSGQADRFYHKYIYDKDDRLTHVYTGRDSIIWDEDARYFYYLNGPLMRTELGDLKVQGLDYAYNIQGWLKAVNGPVMHYLNDMGNDGGYNNINLPGGGSVANPNRYVGRDAMAFYLSYYDGDYSAVANTGSTSMNAMQPILTASDPLTHYRNLYNGNIAMMGTSVPDRTAIGSRTLQNSTMGNVYHYDQLNRITEHKTFTNLQVAGSNWSWANTGFNGTTAFYESFSYDANGNIRTLMRNGENATTSGSIDMDDLTYKYDIRDKAITVNGSGVTLKQLQNNKLWHVNDAVGSGAYSTDIDDQASFVSYPGNIAGVNNYKYDEIGNLIYDSIEQIEEIIWNVQGKISEIVRKSGSAKPDIIFGYDASGQRLFKTVIPKNGSGQREDEKLWTTQFYIRDAKGNVMATYALSYLTLTSPQNYSVKLSISDWQLYGRLRLGNMKVDSVLASRDFTATFDSHRFNNVNYTQNVVTFATQNLTDMVFIQVHGSRQFELSNHLGNVMTTIQDRKLAKNSGSVVDYFQPYITTVSEYYAFGNEMAKRSFKVNRSYRYGFNSKEIDLETECQDYGFRIYNLSIGRFLSVDPISKKYPELTPYQFASNNPIWAIDLDGLEAYVLTQKFDQNVNFTSSSFVWDEKATPLKSGQLHSVVIINGVETSNTVMNAFDVVYYGGYINPTVAPSSILGTVSYYTWRENDFNVRQTLMDGFFAWQPSAPDYYLDYGDKYIKKFSNELRPKLSPEGQQWLDDALINLQKAIEEKLKSNIKIEEDNDAFKKFAFESHVAAYEDAGLFDLPILDLLKIGTTPDIDDFFSKAGFKQVIQICKDYVDDAKKNPAKTTFEIIKFGIIIYRIFNEEDDD